MKDSLLINNGLPNQFWDKVKNITNYLLNWLLTKYTNIAIIILEEV